MRTSLSLGLSRIGGSDLTAPVIVSSLPADNATGVADTVNPLITFNEDVFPGTGLITLRQNNAGWSDVETFDVVTEIGLGPGQVYFSGTNISINPTANLVAGREYAIRIASTAAQDGSGNFFAGVADDTTISFTIAAGDLIAPTIVSTNPVDGATGVAVGSNIAITFSENVVFGTGLITLRENISGTWSDLETFDVVTEVGVGNGQVSISGAVLTINPTASLAATREYAIRIAPTAIRDAAANAFAGIANDTTFSFTSAPGVAPFTARFGHGTLQPANTGNFDTNLYTASPPANGTYGNFTVNAGIISCNGSQTPGTYDVGGYPVQVLDNFRAVRSQAEMNAVQAPIQGAGKTLCIREGSAIDWSSRNSGEFGFRTDFNGMVMLGDGPSVIEDIWNTALDSRKHFNSMNIGAQREITYRNIRCVRAQKGFTMSFSVGSWTGQLQGYITIDECLIVASRPDPNGDYSGGSATFPGDFGIYFNLSLQGVTLTNNRVIGARRGYRIPAGSWLEVIGCESWLSYEDGFQMFGANCPTLVGGCVFGIGLARGGDLNNPHGDAMSIFGEPQANTVVEACAVFAGNQRGRSSSQTYYFGDADVAGFQAHVRDCVVATDADAVTPVLYVVNMAQTQGSTIEHVAYVNTPHAVLPRPPTGLRFGDLIRTGTNRLTNVISVLSGVHPSVIQTGNFSAIESYTASDWEAMYENWTIDSLQYPPLQKIMADLRTKTTGPGNGKGHRVTFSGPKNSDYVINGGAIPTPTLLNLTMTSTSIAGPTATIVTDVELHPIFFAIVPVGTPITDARAQIKRRAITGALSYGYESVHGGEAVNPITLTMAGTGLVAGTQYDVVAMQENGWTKVSAVSRVTFTAT